MHPPCWSQVGGGIKILIVMASVDDIGRWMSVSTSPSHFRGLYIALAWHDCILIPDFTPHESVLCELNL
jgi:hypothetical protein